MEHKIQIGDVIGKIGGIRPENLSELNRLLARLNPGDKINLTVLRASNAEDKTPLISVSSSHNSETSDNPDKTDSENKSENPDKTDSENKTETPDEAKAQKPKTIAKTRIDFTDFKIE